MEAGIGIDMGGTRIKIGLVSNGEILATSVIQSSAHVSLEERLKDIGEHVDQLLQKTQCTPTGLGIAFPGIVDTVGNKILSRYVKFPDAQRVNLSQWAQGRWGTPLVLENDARAALLGEWKFGAGKSCDNLVLITLGTGVGTAALINGRLLHGKHFLAGSLGGHMSINLNGDVCNCGNLGCVESEASTWALQKIAARYADFNDSVLAKEAELNFDLVFNAARNGDSTAIAIQDHALRAWSVAIINIIHAYDPERILIGGGIMRSKHLIVPYVQNMIKKDTWINDHVIDLVPAEHVEYAGILGMGHLITSISSSKPAL